MNEEPKKFTDGVIKLSYKQGIPCMEIIAKKEDDSADEN